MRYTTIIDISEMRLLYRNANVRLMYLHLCLKSGYHDNDRDILDISLRRLADDVGMTLSATRHALRMLNQFGLISIQGGSINVKKWIQEESITKRSRNRKQQQEINEQQERERRQAELQQQHNEREKQRQEYERKGTNSFIEFYENRYAAYQYGQSDAIVSLRRNLNAYLDQCEKLKHKPIITAI